MHKQNCNQTLYNVHSEKAHQRYVAHSKLLNVFSGASKYNLIVKRAIQHKAASLMHNFLYFVGRLFCDVPHYFSVFIWFNIKLTKMPVHIFYS